MRQDIMKTENASVTVKEVSTKAELRKFVDFPNRLYKDNPYFVPSFYGDDLADWDKNKNPAFDYCEGKCFLAYRDGEIVGRIGAILSHASNEKWNTNRMRFTSVDFIDDEAVSAALFAAVEAWALEKGCDEVHGPLGFCDLDREGMLVEGFDQRSMFFTYYNHPYYNDHLEKLGYSKDVDWIEYKVFAPEKDSKLADQLHRISERVQRMKKLHVAVVKHQREYSQYIERVFKLLNTAYSELYSVVELNERQIDKYKKKFAPLISPDFACFVLDEEENVVAFGVSAMSTADVMRKHRGRLFPTGWIDVLRSLNHGEVIDLFLIAVRPDLQGAGVNAIMLDHVMQSCWKRGVKYAETGPQLEHNIKMLSQWKMFDKVQHKRRRCYIKKIK